MIWTIKTAENQNFVCVHLFSWDSILANWTVDEMFSVLQNGSKFVKISWNVVNINEIKFVEPYNPNDIEIFIATQTDSKIKNDLQKIMKERDEKNLKTNGVEHLRSIYETRNQ